MAGIAGTATEGCPSLVLGGGYEDDVDDGDSFTYTGSGGRDLSGNKRTAPQSSGRAVLPLLSFHLSLNLPYRPGTYEDKRRDRLQLPRQV